MSADVDLDQVTIRFGSFTAVQKAHFTIKGGEFFSILGPSGCGKTTLLRTISGFLEPSEGQVRIGGRDMAGIGPNKRPTALIFQNLALFPLMSVAENIGYGLRVRGMNRADRDRKVTDLLKLVAMPDQSQKRISELSGGQKQRVAIARALAVEPQVLLLDEPLSALDLRLRQHMRAELRAIQQRVGITFVYITHDQGEALTMSDRIAVMNAGRVEQIGDGQSIYYDPATHFVASFVGENNGFDGTVSAAADGAAAVDTPLGRLTGRSRVKLESAAKVTYFIRPGAIRIASGAETPRAAAKIVNSAFEGNMTHLFLRSAGGTPITVSLTRRDGLGDVSPGRKVGLVWDEKDGLVIARPA